MKTGNSLRNILETNQIREFISIDIETTGLSPIMDSIVQVAAIKFNLSGKVLETYEKLYKPEGNYIPGEASDIHGITFDKVKEYPTYKNNSTKIKTFCDGVPLVGHNIIDFDIRFLDFDHVKTPHIFDTLNIAKETWQTRTRPSLVYCCKHADIHQEGDVYHNAFFDAKQTMKLFLFFYNLPEQLNLGLKKQPDETIVATVKKQVRSEARQFDKVMRSEEKKVILEEKKVPYLLNSNLFIPFDSPIENHWWKKNAEEKIFSHTTVQKMFDKYGKEYEEKTDHYETKKLYPNIQFKPFDQIRKEALL
jgi:DNA polymerase III epsilon subunit-like protein